MSHLHLTVAAVVERHKRFLLVEEQVSGTEVINQPAGHVEPGESLLHAVVREMLEETAWTFDPAYIVGIYLWQHPEKDDRFLRVVFAGSVTAHDPERPLDDGILRTLWLSRERLLQRSAQLRSPLVMRAVDDYIEGQRYPVTMFQHIDVEAMAERARVV